jgi:exopolysaccharide biosynthesis protein
LAKIHKKVLPCILILLITMSFIYFYAGHFLYAGAKHTANLNTPAEGQINNSPAVQYSHSSIMINNCIQKINILDINTKKSEVKPVLSYDSIFGFETLSSIVKRTNACAGVNAGFFYEYGQPGGLVIADDRLLTTPSGRFPAYVMQNGKPYLKDFRLKLYLSYKNVKLKIDTENTLEEPGRVVLYTPDFGPDNNCSKKNISVVIVNNTVKSLEVNKKNVHIPSNGTLLTFYEPFKYSRTSFPLKVGDKVKIETTPSIRGISQAYECGGWVIKDGKNVVGRSDPWIGLLTNRDPRTVIGIKGNGHVVLATVDGRQPGYSIGMTGSELAEFLLSIGVKNAAMLDGGASTEMIVKGNMVNRPADDGHERLLGGGIIVKLISGEK